MQITKLSQDAKAALNVYLNPDVLFDVSGCSGRVIERICTFSRGRIMVEVYGGNTYAGNSAGKSRARCVPPQEAGEKYWLYRLSEEVCGDEEISAEIPLAEEVQAARLEHNPCEDRILRRKYEKELSRRRRAEAGNDANGAGIRGGNPSKGILQGCNAE